MTKKKITVIAIAGAIVLIAIVTLLAVQLNRKPSPAPIEPVSDASSAPSSSPVSSDFDIPEIIPPLPSSQIADSGSAIGTDDSKTSSTVASNSVASKAPDKKPTSSKTNEIKVTGSVSSSAVSSRPVTETTPPASSQPPAEPLPPSTSEPVDPPFNPDGPQHGDTMDFDGETQYFHVGWKTSRGQGMYLPNSGWNLYGNYPNMSSGKDTSFLHEGDSQITLLTKEKLYWCNCGVTPQFPVGWKNEKIYSREHPSATK